MRENVESNIDRKFITELEQSWDFLFSLTMDFIGVVPDSHWETEPHPKFGSFARQVRHLVRVQGSYNKAFLDKTYNIHEDHYSFYSGDSSRSALTKGLLEKDHELREILHRLRSEETSSFAVKLLPMGISLGFTEFCATIIQHIAIHHGQWCFYAALGEYETPLSWKKNWAL